MIAAVYDSNVITSGLVWRGESHLCILAQARRRIRVFTSAWILEEVRRSLQQIQETESHLAHDPWPALAWFTYTARNVAPSPTGKQRSRDPKDDPILGTALASPAKIIVTFDRDLPALEKPFGLEMIRPAKLLQRLQSVPA